MKLLITFAVIVLFASSILTIWRTVIETRIDKSWGNLTEATQSSSESKLYTTELVANLPPNVQSFFNFVFEPGAQLKPAARFKMTGQLGLGPKANPGYKAMTAQQVHRFPVGFIWRAKTGAPPLSVSGSDGVYLESSWSYFWISGQIPVVRAKGERNNIPDHYRSAFGRFVCEAIVFTPAAILDSPFVHWEDVAENHIRATVIIEGLTQVVDIFLDERGAPVEVVFPRWTDANPENRYQMQPFGGQLSNHRTFEGVTIPTRIEAGNFFGTDEFFPFYIAEITDLDFID